MRNEHLMWDPTHETMPREAMQALQTEKLQRTVLRAYENVPLYRRRMDEADIKPADIRTLSDLAKMPFTVKTDLRDEYPFGLLAVPMEDIARIHASSGTTGKPIVAGYTKNDLSMWSDCIARICTAAGVTKADVAQIAFGYSLFTGAFGLHYGLEKIGTAIIPISGGNTERQVEILQDFGATVLVSTPSYALYLAETAVKTGAAEHMKLKIGLFGAESSTRELRREIEKKLGLVATENYGLTEIVGPGVAGECLAFSGQHINEDHFYPEIINPDTGEVLPLGSEGELVLTTLSKEGQPMIRYRTRDITRLAYAPCACGRTLVRMEEIKGRSDDMLIIRGVNVFPSQIESVLVATPGIGPHYELVLTRHSHLDRLTIKVELINGELLERFRELETLEQLVKTRLRTVLGIDVGVQLSSPNTLKRFEGKAKRITDLRGQSS